MNKSILFITFIFSLLVSSTVYGHDNVVVIPLPSHKAVGDAEVTDVKAGKTFSNSTDIGLTGTRPHVTLPKTGQDECYDPGGTGILPSCAGTGMDGEYQNGVSVSPRFTDNLDGSVTDNLTGLVWLKDFNCFGRILWADALDQVNNLESGDCDLTDSSSIGDWRLPNRFELASLLDLKQIPSLPPGHPFINVVPDYYWTSSYHSYFVALEVAWAIHFSAGDIQARSMIGLEVSGPPNCYVQAVRDKL